MFPFKISYMDFHEVSSTSKFKKIINQMDADLKASMSVQANNIRDNSRDILWLLDNVHELTPTLWEQFEVKLYKLCKQVNIKIVLTSTFVSPTEASGPVFSFFEPAEAFKKQGEKIQMREIVLSQLTADEALNILHSRCLFDFDEKDLDPTTTGTLNERIKQEPAFLECNNLPGKIIALALELNKKVGERFTTFADLRKKQEKVIDRRLTKRQFKAKRQATKQIKREGSSLIDQTPLVYAKQKSILKNN